jgi:hypothetical protein
MTMDCLEFRRVAGADPAHLSPAGERHAAACPRCAEHLRRLRMLDDRLLRALRIPVGPGVAASPLPAPALRPGRLPQAARPRWLALAASIVAGVLVGTLLWVGGPRDSLAQELVAHLAHEPEALVVTDRAADPAGLEEVLARGGIRLRPGIGTVSYANSCEFRGDLVPHLVVQTDGGPVTVMVLRNERPSRPVGFEEQGHAGRIVPAGPGSIAVLGEPGADLDQVAARVLEAVEWL